MNVFSPATGLVSFLERLDSESYHWVIKRLSGKDTGLTGERESGVNLPRQFIVATFPEVNTREKFNPSLTIPECHLFSHNLTTANLRVIYYDSKYYPRRGLRKKHDEFRVTRWRGSEAPLQDQENTGAVFLLAVRRNSERLSCCCWIARNQDEESVLEQWVGEEIEPGQFYFSIVQPRSAEEGLLQGIPRDWLTHLPFPARSGFVRSCGSRISRCQAD